MEKSGETGKIVIVHDSASSLPENLRTTKYGDLIEVPLTVTVTTDGKRKEWIDSPFKSDDEREKFVNGMRAGKVNTSQPNPGTYMDIFSNIIRNGVEQIAVIPASSGLSGSMNSAILAAEYFKNEANIVVADCKTISIGQGLLVTEADIENRQGEFNSANEVVNRVEELSKELYLAQAFPSLEFLRKGGRIGLAKSLLASTFGIIPIIGVNAEGILEPIDKKMGWSRAREAMIDYVSKGVGQRAVRLAVVYFQSDQLDIFNNEIKDKFVMATDDGGKEFDILQCEQSKVLIAHSGPGVIGLGALALSR